MDQELKNQYPLTSGSNSYAACSDMMSQCRDSAMADCRTLFASHSLTA